jgi:uncharacterized protein
MLGTLLNLFGRSPFAPLLSHMDKVSDCVHALMDLFDAIECKDYATVEDIAIKIADLEHKADITKNDILNHLPKSLFLPIDRGHLVEILNTQDHIADKAEDIAVLSTLKQIEIPDHFRTEFREFLLGTIATFDSAALIVREIHELLESSFGGIEAEKVRAMVEEVSYQEHEVDILQYDLLKKLFQSEELMTYTTFHLWQKICEGIAAISNLAEMLAFRIRLTLELK